MSRALLLGLFTTLLSTASSWGAVSPETLQPGLGYLSGVSCVGARCVAVGGTSGPVPSAAASVSTDGGKSWSIAAVPHGLAALYGVSCTTTARCWAVGELSGGAHLGAVVNSRDGGQSWAVQALPANVATLSSVACLATRCLATGLRVGSVVVTRDGGASWSLRALLPPCKTGICAGGTADALAFPGSSAAFAAGGDQCGGHVSECPGNIWKSRDGGTHWKMVFNGFPFVDAISCIDPSHCWAAAATFTTGVILGSANGGRSWRRQELPSFGGFFNSLSCRLVRRHHHCVAVGQNEAGTAPLIAQTNDGGSHWKLVKAPAGTGPLGGVSIASSGSAQMVGETPGASAALAFGL